MAKQTKKKSEPTSRTIVVPGDLHCGHMVGLTPPDWWLSVGPRGPQPLKKIRATQEEAWGKYELACDGLAPDVAIWMGDLLDGAGPKSGGTEQITTDRLEQAQMAAVCIIRMGAPLNIIIRGTGYHTGSSEQFEDSIPGELAKMCKFEKIKNLTWNGPHDHEQLDIDGVVFDVKHKIGSSSIPHGGYTPLSKDDLWNALYAEAGLQTRSDWLVRAHTHTHLWGGRMAGSKTREFCSIPALQCMGSRYGKQQCSKLVDWGVLAFHTRGGAATPDRTYVQTIHSQASAPQVI